VDSLWSQLGLVSYFVLWAVVLVQAVLLLSLSRLVGRLSKRLPPSGARMIDPGPDLGRPLPEWRGTDLLGRERAWEFPRERGVLLLYLSPHCSTCTQLAPAAKRFFREIRREAEGVWVLTISGEEARRQYIESRRIADHPVVDEQSLPDELRLGGAPFAIWADAEGVVRAKGMVNTREHLESLREAAATGRDSIEAYLEQKEQEREKERVAG